MPDNTVQFEQQLASRQQSYELLTPLDQAHCRFRFSGPFQGEKIIWDAYLQTLAYYISTHDTAGRGVRQFIDVGEAGECGRVIRIGLNLPLIDHPSILKTLVMIRQYKRLAPGRREFGEVHHFG
jgi:hypothetical protein